MRKQAGGADVRGCRCPICQFVKDGQARATTRTLRTDCNQLSSFSVQSLRSEPFMASLCLLGEDGLPIGCWELGEEPLAIGRDDSADVKIDDQSLSRRHFLIRPQGDHFLIEDLGSQNGTWVDGNRAPQVRLRHHDCILAGRTLFLFSEHTVTGSRRLSAKNVLNLPEPQLVSSQLNQTPSLRT